MRADKRKLVREQLQASLARFGSLVNTPVPPKGWIRAIRTALGMSGRQLAERMGVSKQRASDVEKQELDGSATIKTMRRVAEGLDCVFVFGFVPKTSLEETVRARAQQVAAGRFARASQTMALEDQALSEEEQGRVFAEMADEIVDSMPSDLWNEHE